MFPPVIVVVAGPNGAGKSSFVAECLNRHWFERDTWINPDEIAKDLGDWNDPVCVLRAAQIADERRNGFLLAKKSFIFETVLSAQNKPEFLKKAQESGYFIHLIFLGTNTPEINAGRVARRVMQGGHDVPIPKIISRYPKSIRNALVVAGFADLTHIFDTSLDGPAKLLLSLDSGAITWQTELVQDTWYEPFQKAFRAHPTKRTPTMAAWLDSPR